MNDIRLVFIILRFTLLLVLALDVMIVQYLITQSLPLLQVLVMTAQILLNILRHSIIKMEAINLLILDECHHAVKKHPYSLVMSEFYHTTPKEKRPCVFGMTASPVNLKCIGFICGSYIYIYICIY